MPVREIVVIDEEKCDGCGLCVPACHEGALQIINGKAKLISETYCDGLGDCLGECPLGAITIEEKEVAPYDEIAVEKHLKEIHHEKQSADEPRVHGGCPGSALRNIMPAESPSQKDSIPDMSSQLRHWPIQLMLVPPSAPFLKDSDILICADCVPFAVPDFHGKYLRGKSLLVGCPKLDDLQHYYEKLRAIFSQATPNSITILKMQVPCCSGIAQAAIQARNDFSSEIPVTVRTFGIEGEEIGCDKIEAGVAA
ncbi:MAG: 4Fe-4S ferredoxin [candidate division Zixibacteria bacterium]|nr:4Fe-4S ferredoxin [candidate division Zixibacteria bacterium]